MMLLKLKAKVLLVDEGQMEIEDKYDLGNIAKSKEWVWRNIAVCAEDVYRIIEYNNTKTVVQMNDEEKILVNEPFEQVYKKWDEVKRFMEDPLPEEGEESEDQEENEEE
jgi:hypothetical protein